MQQQQGGGISQAPQLPKVKTKKAEKERGPKMAKSFLPSPSN
jgi:hypothetical protein